jgi:hypothetical protein
MARKQSVEGKTASVAIRTTPALREKLERAAERRGHSFAQEVETRLEASFDEGLLSSSSPLEFASLSFLRTAKICLLDLVRLSGKSWSVDEPTREAARAIVETVFDGHVDAAHRGAIKKADKEKADRLMKVATSMAELLTYKKDQDQHRETIEQEGFVLENRKKPHPFS